MRRFIIFFTIFLFSSCGYGTHSVFYSEKKINVLPVKNKINVAVEERRLSDFRTFPLLIEKRLTNSIVRKFNIDGYLKVINKNEGDSLTLVCTIVDYRKESLRYTGSEDIEEQRLRLYVDLVLKDKDDKVIKNTQIVGETTFFLTGSRAKTETAAWDDLIDDTSRRITEAVLEQW